MCVMYKLGVDFKHNNCIVCLSPESKQCILMKMVSETLKQTLATEAMDFRLHCACHCSFDLLTVVLQMTVMFHCTH